MNITMTLNWYTGWEVRSTLNQHFDVWNVWISKYPWALEGIYSKARLARSVTVLPSRHGKQNTQGEKGVSRLVDIRSWIQRVNHFCPKCVAQVKSVVETMYTRHQEDLIKIQPEEHQTDSNIHPVLYTASSFKRHQATHVMAHHAYGRTRSPSPAHFLRLSPSQLSVLKNNRR